MNTKFPLGIQFRYEDKPLLWSIDNIYSKQECDDFIKLVESSNPLIATNNPTYRDQNRVIIDDSKIAEDLFSRIKDSLPTSYGDFKLSRLNDRLRFYKYTRGQKFLPHMDHWYQVNDFEITLLTVLVYFNDNFEGGETNFMEQVTEMIKPEIGKVAIFQHKIRHEGCEVLKGIKYAMRTDVIYSKKI